MKRKYSETLTSKSSLVYRQYSSHIINKKLCTNALYLKYDNTYYCMKCGWKTIAMVSGDKSLVESNYVTIKCFLDDKIGMFIKDVLPN